MKRFLSATLALSLLVTLFGCFLGDDPIDPVDLSPLAGDSAPAELPAEKPVPLQHPFTIAWDQTDSLNPFFAISRLNLSAIRLLFDSLFILAPNFSPVPSLCESYDVTGPAVTLFLKDNLTFHDGSALTAADVVYSLREYMRRDTYYSSALEMVRSVSAGSDDRTVILQLSRPEGTFLPSLLTMPIVKSGEAPEDYPTGSGRYQITESGGHFVLSPFSGWHGGDNAFGDIRLLPVTTPETLLFAMSSGEVDVVETEKLSSSSLHFRGSYATLSFPTLSMHYLGINHTAAPLNLPKVRQAISLLMDRHGLSGEMYGGFADPADLPVHPSAPFAASSAAKQDIAQARALFEEAGLTKSEEDETLSYPAGRRQIPFSPTVLVNSDNAFKIACAEVICAWLGDAGISAAVEAVSFDEYKRRLSAGNFTLYLGETLLAPDMRLSDLLTRNGPLNFGRWQPERKVRDETGGIPPDLSALYDAWRQADSSETQAAADAFLLEFFREMPFIPLCFERNALLFHGAVPENVQPAAEDLFYGIETWQAP